MSTPGIIFALAVVTIAWAYFGYPVLVWLLAWLFPRPLCPSEPVPRAVSIVIAAYNEAKHIHRRVTDLLQIIESLDPSSEIIVVSDGSTDGTDQIAREAGDRRVRVIQLSANAGKAVALNTGVAMAGNPIVVFGDARQTWAPDAMKYMLANYADPAVGAVSGDLVLQNHDGSLAGVGLYWKLEKRLRCNEGIIGSSVGVTGAICSVRRELYVPLAPGIILDDVCWPLAVIMQHHRVVHEPRAHAFDRLPENPRDELRRKIRTLAGNFQLLQYQPATILPWRNPVWLGVICHKLLRLLVPWAMITALVACALAQERWLHVMLLLQLAGYGIGVLGLLWKRLGRWRLVNAASSLLVLNTAALMAWLVYFSGRSGKSWRKVAYNPSTSQQSSPVTAS